MTAPEDMEPEELREFVQCALRAAKAKPLPEDMRRWRDGCRVRPRDLSIMLTYNNRVPLCGCRGVEAREDRDAQ